MQLSAACLIPVAILSTVIIWRAKDIQAGARFFLTISAFTIAVVFIPWMFVEFLPIKIQLLILGLASIGLLIFILVSGILYWLNKTKGGKLIAMDTESGTRNYLFLGSLFFAIAIIGFMINTTGASTLPMLFAANILGKRFLAFQIREKGLVSKGRLIRFDDLETIRWINLKDKTEAELTYKASKQVRRIKIPWSLIIPIDNYIKTNFPRT